MSTKIPYERIKEIYDKNDLELLETESKGVLRGYKCRDKEGYLFYYGARNLQKQGISNHGVHVFSSKNPYSWDNVLHYMRTKVKNKTSLLSDKSCWKNRDSVLTFQCGVCGQQFKKRWGDFYKLDFQVCNRCYWEGRKNGDVPTKRTDSFAVHQAFKKCGLIPLFGDLITYKDNVLVQDFEGYRGKVWVSSVLTRQSKFDKFSTHNPFTIQNLRLYAFLHEYDCIVPDQEYKGDKAKLKIKCSCGAEFEVSKIHFLSGKYKCNRCRGVQSILSEKVEKWLSENNIEFEREKRFEGCANKSQLPFDFYIKNFGCIEVDGQQHYKPIPFNGDEEKGEICLKERQNNDKIKTEYCEKNNISLLRLPFWEIEDNITYKSRLEQFLSIKK